VLREKIEGEAKRQHDEEQNRRAEGHIPVLVGSRDQDKTRWLLPGGGEGFCDVDGGPEMVVVPAGKFMMGSPDKEPDRRPLEGPRHEVTFTRPFAVGRFAVTRGQFAAFVKATGYKTNDGWRKPGFNQDDSHPVVGITSDDAIAYAAWLDEIMGHRYRLLSEAEWEYAARAGTTTPFWWGSSITLAQANYGGMLQEMNVLLRFFLRLLLRDLSKGEYRNSTTPVGSFQPNPWGLYNVHGNVLEWCEDTWHADYNGAPTDGSAWILGNTESGRVVRGGSWYDSPFRPRAACRTRRTGPNIDTGFRLARTLTS
jgi:formylglycine-generating enzyme required for sulfatase activity